MAAGGGRFTLFSEELHRVYHGASKVLQKRKDFPAAYKDANNPEKFTKWFYPRSFTGVLITNYSF